MTAVTSNIETTCQDLKAYSVVSGMRIMAVDPYTSIAWGMGPLCIKLVLVHPTDV